MRYFGAWYGGANYTFGDQREMFNNIEEAKSALRDRLTMGHHFPQTFRNTDGEGNVVETISTLTPCVDESSEILLYAADKAQYGVNGWDYPCRRVYFGPRGGVRVEDL